jgi:EmrB/QacA subfamily drug resistance transporter
MDRHIRPLVALVAAATFMEMLDGTVIVTALPVMGHVFGVRAVSMNLGISAYLLAVAVCLPASGWAAERFGVRRVFLTGLAVFTLASLLCALSQDLSVFVAARILQGIGGSAMVSIGRLAVLRVTPKAQIVHAIGAIVWPGLIAPVLGPALGGFLVTYASWRWIFLLNLPLGLLALIAAWRLMPAGAGEKGRALDIPGLVLFGLALAALVGGANSLGAGNIQALWVVATGAGLAALTWRHCRRRQSPFLEFGAMRHRSFAVGVAGGSAFRVAINSAPFLLPLFFQLVLGYNAFHAGLLLLALFAGNLLMKTATTRMLRAFGFRRIMTVNGALAAVSLAACAAFAPGAAVWAIVVVLFLGGMSRSMQFTAGATLQFAEVPQAEMGPANTLGNLVMQLSMGLGPAFGGLCLDIGAALSHHATPGLAAFQLAFILAGLLALLGVADSFRLAPDAGQMVSGHKRAE